MDDRIWIAADHAGYELKSKLVAYMEEQGIPVHDIGCRSTDFVRYPYFAAEIASRISQSEVRRGVLICSTGIGMSIIANKYKGVRASLCHTVHEARMTRAHNDSNCLCLAGRIIGDYQAIELLKTWLEADYIGGRHDIALSIIAEAEAANFTGEAWVNRAEQR